MLSLKLGASWKDIFGCKKGALQYVENKTGDGVVYLECISRSFVQNMDGEHNDLHRAEIFVYR